MLISEDKQNLGEMEIGKALDLAKSRHLDLYCISKNVQPPICRLGDFFKYKYEKKKKLKEFNKTHSAERVKKIRLKGNIAKNDLQVKANKAIGFLKDGHKVTVSLALWGRQMQNTKEFSKSLHDFIELVSEYGDPASKDVKQHNNFFEILINPKKRK